MVYGLIIANVAVYMLWQVADSNFMRDNFMVSQILNYMLLDDACLDFVCHTLAWCGILSQNWLVLETNIRDFLV